MVGKVRLCVSKGVEKLPVEECKVAYFPTVKTTRGKVGSVPPSSCCYGAPFLPSALRILFFRPANRQASIVIKPIMIFVVLLMRGPRAARKRRSFHRHLCRLGERRWNGTAGDVLPPKKRVSSYR